MKKSSSPIIITGAGRRVGLTIAQSLHEQRSEPVIITYRTYYEEINELKKMGITCICADFSTPEGIYEFIDNIKQNYQSIRAIIHNASEWLSESNSDSLMDCLDSMMNIHIKVPYLINEAFADLLRHDLDTKGDIIHITDRIIEKGSDKHIAYAASKAAMNNLTLSYAKKLAPEVKVNSIAPGLLLFNDNDSADYKAAAKKKSLMQREGGTNEVLSAISYLLDSHFVTGRTLFIDGGRHLV